MFLSSSPPPRSPPLPFPSTSPALPIAASPSHLANSQEMRARLDHLLGTPRTEVSPATSPHVTSNSPPTFLSVSANSADNKPTNYVELSTLLDRRSDTEYTNLEKFALQTTTQTKLPRQRQTEFDIFDIGEDRETLVSSLEQPTLHAPRPQSLPVPVVELEDLTEAEPSTDPLPAVTSLLESGLPTLVEEIDAEDWAEEEAAEMLLMKTPEHRDRRVVSTLQPRPLSALFKLSNRPSVNSSTLLLEPRPDGLARKGTAADLLRRTKSKLLGQEDK